MDFRIQMQDSDVDPPRSGIHFYYNQQIFKASDVDEGRTAGQRPFDFPVLSRDQRRQQSTDKVEWGQTFSYMKGHLSPNLHTIDYLSLSHNLLGDGERNAKEQAGTLREYFPTARCSSTEVDTGLNGISSLVDDETLFLPGRHLRISRSTNVDFEENSGRGDQYCDKPPLEESLDPAPGTVPFAGQSARGDKRICYAYRNAIHPCLYYRGSLEDVEVEKYAYYLDASSAVDYDNFRNDSVDPFCYNEYCNTDPRKETVPLKANRFEEAASLQSNDILNNNDLQVAPLENKDIKTVSNVTVSTCREKEEILDQGNEYKENWGPVNELNASEYDELSAELNTDEDSRNLGKHHQSTTQFSPSFILTDKCDETSSSTLRHETKDAENKVKDSFQDITQDDLKFRTSAPTSDKEIVESSTLTEKYRDVTSRKASSRIPVRISIDFPKFPPVQTVSDLSSETRIEMSAEMGFESNNVRLLRFQSRSESRPKPRVFRPKISSTTSDKIKHLQPWQSSTVITHPPKPRLVSTKPTKKHKSLAKPVKRDVTDAKSIGNSVSSDGIVLKQNSVSRAIPRHISANKTKQDSNQEPTLPFGFSLTYTGPLKPHVTLKTEAFEKSDETKAGLECEDLKTQGEPNITDNGSPDPLAKNVRSSSVFFSVMSPEKEEVNLLHKTDPLPKHGRRPFSASKKAETSTQTSHVMASRINTTRGIKKNIRGMNTFSGDKVGERNLHQVSRSNCTSVPTALNKYARSETTMKSIIKPGNKDRLAKKAGATVQSTKANKSVVTHSSKLADIGSNENSNSTSGVSKELSHPSFDDFFCDMSCGDLWQPKTIKLESNLCNNGHHFKLNRKFIFRLSSEKNRQFSNKKRHAFQMNAVKKFFQNPYVA